MSKKTLILVIALVVVASVLIFVALLPKKKAVTPPPPPPSPTSSVTQTTEPTVAPESTLTLSPNSSASSVDVNINTGTNNVTAVQLELIYDPQLLTNVDISAPLKEASFFKNPITLIKKIDQEKGKIIFAIGISPTGTPQKGMGIVSVIKFTKASATVKSATISFSPQTLVTADGAPNSVLKSTIGTTINFP